MNFCRWFIYVIFLKRKIKKIKNLRIKTQSRANGKYTRLSLKLKLSD